MRNTIHVGNCLDTLKPFRDASVQCCVTMPPSYGLRGYGIEGQVGSETTLEEYVKKLVDIFREVRRVLRDDGILWVSVRDSYFSTPTCSPQRGILAGLTPVEPGGLGCIPWHVAPALQGDGWILRGDIIWATSCMPESITDRCSQSHQHVFFLTKSARYFYDPYAIRELRDSESRARVAQTQCARAHGWEHGPRDCTFAYGPDAVLPPNGRNRRTVWQTSPRSYREFHFDTMHAEVHEMCIKAGTSAKGACPLCGAPWRPVLKKSPVAANATIVSDSKKGQRGATDSRHKQSIPGGQSLVSTGGPTIAWKPTCKCPEHEPVPCLVLDPFARSGTILAAAKGLGRDYVGIELNPECAKLIEERVRPARPQGIPTGRR